MAATRSAAPGIRFPFASFSVIVAVCAVSPSAVLLPPVTTSVDAFSPPSGAPGVNVTVGPEMSTPSTVAETIALPEAVDDSVAV